MHYDAISSDMITHFFGKTFVCLLQCTGWMVLREWIRVMSLIKLLLGEVGKCTETLGKRKKGLMLKAAECCLGGSELSSCLYHRPLT